VAKTGQTYRRLREQRIARESQECVKISLFLDHLSIVTKLHIKLHH